MTGVTKLKKCLSGTFFMCVKTWEGVESLDLNKFKTIEPPYYGAFEHVSNPGLKTRKLIVETAENLKKIIPSIKYIVIENDSFLDLKDHYFVFRKDNDGIVEPDEILRMRSDAFVEYCYAKAKFPIMQSDITTESGAEQLQFLSGFSSLYPHDQRDSVNMRPSVITNPQIVVVEKNTNKQLSTGIQQKRPILQLKRVIAIQA
ncbi:MAG: hypothetical protein KAJ48_08200 [Elusimicrobiales bacterium]|nr:hypothetical protein [Elusimicrobiales bacterium]